MNAQVDDKALKVLLIAEMCADQTFLSAGTTFVGDVTGAFMYEEAALTLRN